MADQHKRLKIAVTGSAGSGKSLVCRRLDQIGVKTLDCDKIARQVVEPGQKGLEELVKTYGTDICTPDGGLDRKHLRAILVRDDTQKKVIEQILHPLIQEKMCCQMEKALYIKGVEAVAVEVPLLFESGMDTLFDKTIAVIGEPDQLVQRISGRDNVSDADAKRLLDLQMSQQEKQARADHILKNTGSESQLFESVDKLFEKIQKEFLTS